MKINDIDGFKAYCHEVGPQEVKTFMVYDRYPLTLIAVGEKSLEGLKFLIEEMAYPIDKQAKNGETALIRACHFKNIDIVRYLLSRGADTEIRNKQHITAFITAYMRDKPDIVTELLWGGC